MGSKLSPRCETKVAVLSRFRGKILAMGQDLGACVRPFVLYPFVLLDFEFLI